MSIENDSFKKAIHRLALSESGFVFDPVSGLSFTVNETGLDILRQLQLNPSTQHIHDFLQQHYQADSLELNRDIDDFIAAVAEQMGQQ